MPKARYQSPAGKPRLTTRAPCPASRSASIGVYLTFASLFGENGEATKCEVSLADTTRRILEGLVVVLALSLLGTGAPAQDAEVEIPDAGPQVQGVLAAQGSGFGGTGPKSSIRTSSTQSVRVLLTL